MAPSDRLRSSSAAQRKGPRKGSAKAAPPPPKQGLSKAAKRAATVAANKAKDREVENQDDSGEEEASEKDKDSSNKDSGGEDGTDGSSSAGSDISDDTREELVKLIAERRAAKKRRFARTSTAVVTAAAAKVSVDKAARKARSNDVAVAEEKRKKSRVTLGRIIAKIGTGTVAEKAGLKISGLPIAHKGTSSKKGKRKALSSPEAASSSDEEGEEDHDVVELPAIPAKTRRIRKSVDKLIGWLSKSTFTLLPTPLPTFTRAEGPLALVYTASLITVSARFPQGAGSRFRHNYESYLSLLDVVQRYLPQLFADTPAALPDANLYVFDTLIKIKAQLDEATRMLDGQQGLIDLTFGSFTTQLCADGDSFDPLAAIVKLMASVSSSVLAKQTKNEINDTYRDARGFSPVLQQRHHQHQQQQQQQQHPGGKGSGATRRGSGKGGGKNGQQRPPPPPGLPGMVWIEAYRAYCRYPTDGNGASLRHACVRCGAGSVAGYAGHHGTACLATVAEKADWLQHARPVH